MVCTNFFSFRLQQTEEEAKDTKWNADIPEDNKKCTAEKCDER
jgi:hypothetical protein